LRFVIGSGISTLFGVDAFGSAPADEFAAAGFNMRV
jgi:hypothetical protein